MEDCKIVYVCNENSLFFFVARLLGDVSFEIEFRRRCRFSMVKLFDYGGYKMVQMYLLYIYACICVCEPRLLTGVCTAPKKKPIYSKMCFAKMHAYCKLRYISDLCGMCMFVSISMYLLMHSADANFNVNSSFLVNANEFFFLFFYSVSFNSTIFVVEYWG